MKTQIETVRTKDFSMDFFRFGKGEKTLVILPGLSLGSVMAYVPAVAKAYSPLADVFSVYLIDRRKELPSAYSVYEMAEDTATAVRELSLEEVCVFGASQGGMMALAMADRHPELVRKLAVGSTSARVEPEQYRMIENWARLARDGKAEELYLAFGEAIYPPEVFGQYRRALAAGAAMATDRDLKRFAILAEGTKGFDLLDRVGQISCPILVIGSRDDGVLGPGATERIAEQLKDRPDCETYMYSGYGHAAYDLAPDYKERLRRFLTAEAVSI